MQPGCNSRSMNASDGAGTHQRGPDAISLMFGCDRHRSKHHESQFGVPDKRYGREHDVADDRAAVFRYKRDNRMNLVAQGVDKIGFSVSVEGGRVHRFDCSSVLLPFSSDNHALTLDV